MELHALALDTATEIPRCSSGNLDPFGVALDAKEEKDHGDHPATMTCNLQRP
jgi:hypothetical protein